MYLSCYSLFQPSLSLSLRVTAIRSCSIASKRSVGQANAILFSEKRRRVHKQFSLDGNADGKRTDGHSVFIRALN